MNFLCQGGTVKSINDGQEHHVSSHSVRSCFGKALENFKGHSFCFCEGSHRTFNGEDSCSIILKPREDGNYSMVDEIFKQFKPKEKWASVAITGKDGKPFYIKDKELVNEIIMRCDSAVVGVQGNNCLFNKLIDEVVQRPEPKPEESSEAWEKRYDEWQKFWGAKPVVLDCEVFDVQLLSSCYMNGPLSFVNPETGKVGLVMNCRWTWEPIEACKEELQWICDEPVREWDKESGRLRLEINIKDYPEDGRPKNSMELFKEAIPELFEEGLSFQEKYEEYQVFSKYELRNGELVLLNGKEVLGDIRNCIYI